MSRSLLGRQFIFLRQWEARFRGPLPPLLLVGREKGLLGRFRLSLEVRFQVLVLGTCCSAATHLLCVMQLLWFGCCSAAQPFIL